MNVGVFYDREKPPQSPNCTFIIPAANSPTTGTVTYAFETVPGQTLRNVIASQRAALFGPGSIIGEYSTNFGRTFERFFAAIDSSAETRVTLRDLYATNLILRYTLIVPSSWNYNVQLARDCDNTPFGLGFDFDVPVRIVILPRTLNVNSTVGGRTTMTPSGPSFPRGSTVEVTALPDPGFVFRGWFGDVLSYDNPLTLVMDEVKTITPIFTLLSKLDHCTNRPTEIASWWTADGNVMDVVTGGAGTLENGARFTQGYSDFGFAFDGFDEYVQIGETSIRVPWTATMWVLRRDARDALAALISDGVSALKAEQFGTARKVGFTRYGVADWSFNYSVPTNEWTHLAFVAAGGTTRLYVNGALEDSLNATVPLPRGRLGIGVTNPPTDAFNGILDEVALFKRALSTDEVAAIYNAGKSGMCKPPEFLTVSTENHGTLALRVIGPAGRKLTVLDSPNLSTWSVLTTMDNPEGLLDFSMPSVSAKSFFRLQTE